MKIPNQKKSSNKLIIILSVLVGLLLLFAIIGKSLGWVGKKKMFEVDMAKVSFETIVEKVSASGMVRPVIEVKISPEVAGEIIELGAPRIDTKHTHGTGCTLASAVAAGLAQGLELEAAVRRAHGYVQEAIRTAPGFGAGHGPLNHAHTFES